VYVKLNLIKHTIRFVYTERNLEFVNCDSILNYKLKVRFVIGCVKTTEWSDYI